MASGRTRAVVPAVTVALSALVAATAGANGASATTATAQAPGTYVAIAPVRVLDTRHGLRGTGPVAPHGTLHLTVTGRSGWVPSGVSAVVLTVTVTQPTRAGNVTVYPDLTPEPLASNVNFVAGNTIPNLVMVEPGTDGGVAFTNNSPGTVHLVADISGYYLGGAPSVPGAYHPRSPLRVLDTRRGLGAGTVPAGGTVHLPVAAAGVPAGALAVAMNVTVTQPTRAGNLTAYPDLTDEPTASNLNFLAGETIPNFVVVKLGSDGRVALTNNSPGAIQLIADVSGFYLGGGSPTAPGAFVALSPVRVVDTRRGLGGTGPVTDNNAVRIFPTAGGVPAGAMAVVVNATVTQPTRLGYAAVVPYPSEAPTSNLNFGPGQTIPDLVVAGVGTTGEIAFVQYSGGTVQFVGDLSGYFVGLPPEEADNLSATTTQSTVQLLWHIPADSYGIVTDVVVRRAAGTVAPVSPTDGDPVPNVPSGPAGWVTDTGLTPSTTYTYSVFLHYQNTTYSGPASITVSTLAA